MTLWLPNSIIRYSCIFNRLPKLFWWIARSGNHWTITIITPWFYDSLVPLSLSSILHSSEDLEVLNETHLCEWRAWVWKEVTLFDGLKHLTFFYWLYVHSLFKLLQILSWKEASLNKLKKQKITYILKNCISQTWTHLFLKYLQLNILFY